MFRKLRFGPCRQEQSIGAIHFAFHCIYYRDLRIFLQTFTPGQDRTGDVQRARLRWPQDHGCLRKANPASHSCSNLLPLETSRAASHIEPPKFAFRPPILAELHGAAPGIEPGACRARSENHDTRPSSHVLTHTQVDIEVGRAELPAVVASAVAFTPPYNCDPPSVPDHSGRLNS